MTTVAIHYYLGLGQGAFSRILNRKDRWFGFACSIGMHLILLTVGGLILIKPAEFGVNQGFSGIDVQLVTGVEEPVVTQPKVVEEVKPLEQKSPEDFVQEQKIVEPKPEESQKLGNSPVNAFSTGNGALSEAKPDYLQNPAPTYPWKARQNGWEGLVLLKALVNANGDPIKVEIEKSSGHSILDEAAVKSVKTWRFQPAQLGSMKVESSVQIPVRFDLKKTR